MRKRRNKLATCSDTSLYEPPMTPAIILLPYFGRGVDLSLHSNADDSTVFMEARINSSDWLSAYVDDEHESSKMAPNLMPGNRFESSLIWSSAYNIASKRWIPLSRFISPHSTFVPVPVLMLFVSCIVYVVLYISKF